MSEKKRSKKELKKQKKSLKLMDKGTKKVEKFFSDFKTFALKGNVMDMAVGVIIGGAFSKIVASLVADIITPLISYMTGKNDFNELFFVLKTLPDGSKVLLKYGSFLQVTIDFIIIALSIFVVIKVFTMANRKRENLVTNIYGKITKKKKSEKKADEKEEDKKDEVTEEKGEAAEKTDGDEPILNEETNELLRKILLQLQENANKE